MTIRTAGDFFEAVKLEGEIQKEIDRFIEERARRLADQASREAAAPPALVPAMGEIFPDKIDEVNALCEKPIFTIKKRAFLVFEIGKLLNEIWGKLSPVDSWPQWCKEHLAFDVSTANRYMRIYNNFKDNPGALAGLTITGALKLLSAPNPGGKK